MILLNLILIFQNYNSAPYISSLIEQQYVRCSPLFSQATDVNILVTPKCSKFMIKVSIFQGDILVACEVYSKI